MGGIARSASIRQWIRLLIVTALLFWPAPIFLMAEGGADPTASISTTSNEYVNSETSSNNYGIDVSPGGMMWVTAETPLTDVRAYRSNDGVAWEQRLFINRQIVASAVVAATDDDVYVFYTTEAHPNELFVRATSDGGATWPVSAKIASGLPCGRQLDVHGLAAGHVLVATRCGSTPFVYESENHGQTWAAHPIGNDHKANPNLAAVDGSRWFAAYFVGDVPTVWETQDAGESWSARSLPPLPHAARSLYQQSVSVSPFSDVLTYAYMEKDSYIVSVAQSHDGGRSWLFDNVSLPGTWPRTNYRPNLFLHPLGPATTPAGVLLSVVGINGTDLLAFTNTEPGPLGAWRNATLRSDVSTGESKPFLAPIPGSSDKMVVYGPLDDDRPAVFRMSLKGFGPPVVTTSLTAEPGHTDRSINLAWTTNPDLQGLDVVYALTRAVEAGTMRLLANVTDTSYTDTDFTICPAMPWGMQYTYRVQVIVDGITRGQSDPTSAAPCSRTHLLRALNANYDFYWGPSSFDNTDGAPNEAVPFELEDLDARANQTATWFAVPPVEVACCTPLVFDTNLLTDQTGVAIRASLDTLFTPALELDIDFAENAIAALAEAGQGSATFRGARYEGRPELVPDLNHQAAIDLFAQFELAFESATVDLAPPPVSAHGRLFLDEEQAILDGTGLENLIIPIALPTVDFSPDPYSFDESINVDILGLTRVELASARLDAAVSASAGLEGQVQVGLINDSLRPEAVSAGVGAFAAGSVSATGEGRIVGARASASGQATSSAAIKGELVLPTRFDGNAANMYSHYSDIFYEDIRYPVLAIKLGPVDVDLDTLTGSLRLGPVEYDTKWDVGKAANRHLNWDGTIMALGQARVSGNGVSVVKVGQESLAISSTLDDPIHPLQFERDLVIAVAGPAGQTTEVNVERAVASPLSNGTMIVREWNLTLPPVTIGPAGEGYLHMDILATQIALQHDVRVTNDSFSVAASRVSGRFDLNGDGLPDSATPELILNNKRPTSLTITSTGSDGDGHLYVGESGDAQIHIRDVLAGTAPNLHDDSEIRVLFDGNVVAHLPIDQDGRATWTGPVPTTSTEGPHDVAFEFGGDDLNAASRVEDTWHIVDRPPKVFLLEPGALQILNRSESFEASVVVETPKAFDIKVDGVSARLDGGPPSVLASIGPFQYAGRLPLPWDLEDGLHEVSVTATDRGDHASSTATSVIVDRKEATIVMDEPYTTATPRGNRAVHWSADEPVAARLILEQRNAIDPAGSPLAKIILESGEFAKAGSFDVPTHPPGYWTYRLEFEDLAGTQVTDPLVTAPRFSFW